VGFVTFVVCVDLKTLLVRSVKSVFLHVNRSKMSGCESSGDRKVAAQAPQHPDLPKPVLVKPFAWNRNQPKHYASIDTLKYDGPIFSSSTAERYQKVFSEYRCELNEKLKTAEKGMLGGTQRYTQSPELWVHVLFEARMAMKSMMTEMQKCEEAFLAMEQCARDDVKRAKTEKEIEKEGQKMDAVETPGSTPVSININDGNPFTEDGASFTDV